VLGVVLVTAVVTGYVNGYLAVAIAIVLLALPFPLATPDDPLPRGYRAAARMLAGMWVSPRRYPDFAGSSAPGSSSSSATVPKPIFR